MSLGKRIAAKRNERKITQEFLGEKIGVTGAFLSQIERGTRNPSYKLLNKISVELDVPVSYFIGGEMDGFEEDPTSRLIASAIRFLDSERKNKLLEYLYCITGSNKYFNFPFFDSPNDYAEYLLKKYKISNPPIDPFALAESLNIKILYSNDDNEGNEGILYKTGYKPLIVLDNQIQYKNRQRFTVAMLIGHLVIPWHLRDTFVRKKDSHSQNKEDQMSIEALEFAGELLLPRQMLKSDLKSIEPGMQAFERLAYEKYSTSMITIGQRYAQYFDKCAFLTIENEKFSRVYNDRLPYNLVKELRPGSLAYSFKENPPITKEIRKEYVDPNVWFEDPPSKINLYEESLLDPGFGVIVTFLRLK